MCREARPKVTSLLQAKITVYASLLPCMIAAGLRSYAAHHIAQDVHLVLSRVVSLPDQSLKSCGCAAGAWAQHHDPCGQSICRPGAGAAAYQPAGRRPSTHRPEPAQV